MIKLNLCILRLLAIIKIFCLLLKCILRVLLKKKEDYFDYNYSFVEVGDEDGVNLIEDYSTRTEDGVKIVQHLYVVVVYILDYILFVTKSNIDHNTKPIWQGFTTKPLKRTQ